MPAAVARRAVRSAGSPSAVKHASWFDGKPEQKMLRDVTVVPLMPGTTPVATRQMDGMSLAVLYRYLRQRGGAGI